MKRRQLNVIIGTLAFYACSGVTPAYADFPTDIGQWGVGEEKKYHGEQLDRAKKSVEAIDPENATRHPFYEGTDQATVLKNIEYDLAVIENEDTYFQCLQYEEIGKCLKIEDGKAIITPFVRYFGPWQKGEEVPEPFRTGYLVKDQVKEEKRKVIEEDPKYYEDFIKDTITAQIDYSRQVSIPYLNSQLGTSYEITPAPTPDQRIIDATRQTIEKRSTNFGEASMAQDGFVFNEYHLLPAKSPMYNAMIPPPENFFGWCHAVKMVGTWYSEFQGPNILSRRSEASREFFGAEMTIMNNDPFNCLGYNRNQGYTPPQLLAGLTMTASAAPCQGINMGAWVPVLNKVHTTYQTTAAAVGLVRSRVANRTDAASFYDIDPENDKVQWIQNDRMDGAGSVLGEKSSPTGVKFTAKKCSMLKKFVLDYDRGNLKIGPLADSDKGKDHWSVIAHWRKIRCCPLGGSPIFAIPPELPIPILE